jgi:hypothetical protein
VFQGNPDPEGKVGGGEIRREEEGGGTNTYLSSEEMNKTQVRLGTFWYTWQNHLQTEGVGVEAER